MTRALTAAERQRRRRARHDAGRRRIVVEPDWAALEDALLLSGLLSRAEIDDPEKVDAATLAALQDWIAQQLASDVDPPQVSRVTTPGSGLC